MIDKLPFFLMLFPIVAIHEYAHAWLAHKLGDDTAKQEGRMNLNPIVHIDLFGTVILPLINISFGGTPLGFGKSVPVDHEQFQNPVRDRILVALAGPFANVLLAFILLAIGRFAFPENQQLFGLAEQFATYSIFLGCFNLLPFPPMDGWTLIKTIFKIGEDIEQRIGFFWIPIIFICINLPPIRAFLSITMSLTLSLLKLILGIN